MSISQIIIYIIIVLIIFSVIRKSLNKRKVKNYNAEEINNKIKNSRNILLLDVRTNRERKVNHIKGSVHIPLNQLRARVDELKKFKNKEIVCYCTSGNRSFSAALLLQKHGFNAANLKGGITGWNY